MCSALAQSLGYMIWPQNSCVAVAKSVYHAPEGALWAPEYPLCKTVGRIIPYQGVVRIMVQVRIFYCSRAEPSLNRGKAFCSSTNFNKLRRKVIDYLRTQDRVEAVV